jgi:copper chaperone CopZ
MKGLLLTYFLLMLVWANTLSAEQINIDVHGMTCAFCVDSLQRNLRKLPDVESAEVSLKHKKVRIETAGDAVDIERIKQTVLDSGFTPVKVTPLPDAQ